MSGRAREGRSPGGLAYGYEPVPGDIGARRIVEAEAEVVRRIFDEYRSGRSPRDIAHGLNENGIAPPRGTRWNASTINGNATRGNGILQNPIYAGRQVWNRVRMVKDPDTGRRVSRPNPPEEWVVAEVFPNWRSSRSACSTRPRGRRRRGPSPHRGNGGGRAISCRGC